MAKSNSGGAALATHSDVKGILGNLDAGDVVAIMSLHPTIADIEVGIAVACRRRRRVRRR